MARYLVLRPTYLRAVGTAAEQTHEVGAEVEFRGAPGVSLFPLDDSARAARIEFVREHRNKAQRARDDLTIRRHLANLPRPIKAKLATAVKAFDAYVSAREPAARKFP